MSEEAAAEPVEDVAPSEPAPSAMRPDDIPYPPAYQYAGMVLRIALGLGSLIILFILIPVIAGTVGTMFGYRNDTELDMGDFSIIVFTLIPILALYGYRHHIANTVGLWIPLQLPNKVRCRVMTTNFRGHPQEMEFSAGVLLWIDDQEFKEKLEERMPGLEKLMKTSFRKGLQDSGNRLLQDELENFILEEIRIPNVMKVVLREMAFKPVHGVAPPC